MLAGWMNYFFYYYQSYCKAKYDVHVHEFMMFANLLKLSSIDMLQHSNWMSGIDVYRPAILTKNTLVKKFEYFSKIYLKFEYVLSTAQ